MNHDMTQRRFVALPRLKETIDDQGRTAVWFARELGVTKSHFSRVLSGERDVSYEDARLVSAMLGTRFFSLWKVAEGTYRASSATPVAEVITA